MHLIFCVVQRNRFFAYPHLHSCLLVLLARICQIYHYWNETEQKKKIIWKIGIKSCWTSGGWHGYSQNVWERQRMSARKEADEEIEKILNRNTQKPYTFHRNHPFEFEQSIYGGKIVYAELDELINQWSKAFFIHLSIGSKKNKHEKNCTESWIPGVFEGRHMLGW